MQMRVREKERVKEKWLKPERENGKKKEGERERERERGKDTKKKDCLVKLTNFSRNKEPNQNEKISPQLKFCQKEKKKRWVHNFSSKELSEVQVRVLPKGLAWKPTPIKPPFSTLQSPLNQVLVNWASSLMLQPALDLPAPRLSTILRPRGPTSRVRKGRSYRTLRMTTPSPSILPTKVGQLSFGTEKNTYEKWMLLSATPTPMRSYQPTLHTNIGP